MTKNNSTYFDTITLNKILASIDEHLVKLDKKYIKFTKEKKRKLVNKPNQQTKKCSKKISKIFFISSFVFIFK